jgi:hypothetical protein
MKPLQDGYYGKIIDNGQSPTNRILIGVPMTGILRSEWVLARYGQIIPTNWSTADCIMWLDQYSPLRFSVADARNLIVQQAIVGNFEWLFFIDHDTIIPPTTLLRMNEYMLKADIPVVGGLYFTKSVPAEPLVYRGRGTSYFTNWKLGDKVWVDGLGMGCTLIHCSVLKAVWDISEEYQCRGVTVRRVFESPAKQVFDPETLGWSGETGTEDLFFLHRVIDNDLLTKAGWKKIAKKKYPYLVDTSIFCKHIDFNGMQFPARNEELAYLKKEDKEKLGIK